MRVESLTLRDFRCYERAEIALAEGLTVITGPNGAGKTNLLEALYFGCTGRSCRTANERELVRFEAPTTRVTVRTLGDDGPHELAVGFTPGEPKRMRVDGAPVERLLDSVARPLVSVFLPDRLDLVKGPPSLRRAHVDQVVAALWPGRVATRRAYAQTLAQRNALLVRIRAGHAGRGSLESWNVQLAHHSLALMADRAQALAVIEPPFAQIADELGLEGVAAVSYRPRSRAREVATFVTELTEREAGDLERGFTSHGPHRDDLVLRLGGRDLRAYGSQGQQRLALLALLLAERVALAETRDAPPLMLLDDVMSELDRDRRRALVERLRREPGQSVITTTDLEHVPGIEDAGVAHIAVQAGAILDGLSV